MSFELRFTSLLVCASFCFSGMSAEAQPIQKFHIASAEKNCNDACVARVKKLIDKFIDNIIVWKEQGGSKPLQPIIQASKQSQADDLVFMSVTNISLAFQAIETEDEEGNINMHLLLAAVSRLANDMVKENKQCLESFNGFVQDIQSSAKKRNIDIAPYFAEKSFLMTHIIPFSYDFGNALGRPCK